jgi:hypothetical protein
VKAIKLQHRTYLGADLTTKYLQHRINITDEIVKKLGWTRKDQIILNVNDKKKTLTLELKTDNA